MNIRLAPLGVRYEADAMRQHIDQLEQAFHRVLSIETASPFVLLVSPDQSVWRVTVDNAGALHTTKLPKGVPL